LEGRVPEWFLAGRQERIRAAGWIQRCGEERGEESELR